MMNGTRRRRRRPLRRSLSYVGTKSLTTEQLASLVSTSRALCVTTLLADNYVYINVDSAEELTSTDAICGV